MREPCLICGLVTSSSQLVCFICYPDTDFREGAYAQWIEQSLDEYEEILREES